MTECHLKKGCKTQKERLQLSSNQHVFRRIWQFWGEYKFIFSAFVASKGHLIYYISIFTTVTPLGTKTKTTNNMRKTREHPALFTCVCLQLPMDFHPPTQQRSLQLREKKTRPPKPVGIPQLRWKMIDGNTLGPA